MDIKQELKQVIAKYEGKRFNTFEVNFVDMAKDCLREIERLEARSQINGTLNAWQFSKKNYDKVGVPDWIKNSNTPIELWSQFGGTTLCGVIKTLGGNISVAEDDWIIQDPTSGKVWIE